MAYDETPRKKIEIRSMRANISQDDILNFADNYDRYGDRTDAGAEGAGYLGMDDLYKIRRKHLKHETE